MNEDLLYRLERIEAGVSLITDMLSNRDDDVLVSCTEASRLLGKSKTTISTMIREKRLEKVTIGDSTGIRLSDVLELKTP